MSPSPGDHSTADKVAFLASFTRSLIEWNNAETAVRGLVARSQAVTGSPHLANWVLVFGLNTPALVDALRALAHDIYEGDVSEHLAHAAEYFERLAAYRNSYVHGLGAVISHADGRVVGSLSSTVARGKIAVDNEEITETTLTGFMEMSTRLNKYASQISAILVAARRNDDPGPMLEKPDLPEKRGKRWTTLREIKLKNASLISAKAAHGRPAPTSQGNTAPDT